jgi:hypothetical protein
MERALLLANSILRQRERFTRLTLHAPTIEAATEKIAHNPPGLDNWRPTDIKNEENTPTAPETQAGSSLRGNIEEDFPTCYIEEIPYMEDTPTALEHEARDKTRGRLYEDISTCYIEEVPYMDVVSQRTCAVMVHHTDIASMDKDKASAEGKKGNPSEADTKGMHARYGAHPTGQRLYMLPYAYANASAK